MNLSKKKEKFGGEENDTLHALVRVGRGECKRGAAAGERRIPRPPRAPAPAPPYPLGLTLAGDPATAPHASFTRRLKSLPAFKQQRHAACASSRRRARSAPASACSRRDAARVVPVHRGWGANDARASTRARRRRVGYEASAAQHRLLALAVEGARLEHGVDGAACARGLRGCRYEEERAAAPPCARAGVQVRGAARHGEALYPRIRGDALRDAAEGERVQCGVRVRVRGDARRGRHQVPVLAGMLREMWSARRAPGARGYGYEAIVARGTVWALQRVLAGGVRGRGVRHRRPGERLRVRGDPRRGAAPTPRARAADDARAAFWGANTRRDTVWALRGALARMRQVPVFAGMRDIGAQGGGGARTGRTRRAAPALRRARRGALGDTGTKGSAAQGGAAGARRETPNLGRCARAHILPVACCYSCEVFPEAAAPVASPSARRKRARGSVRESRVRTRPRARTAAFSAWDPTLAVDRYLFSPFLQ
ncbi:hypothetical protein DFH09DRAFT_1102458 [Mycena vulgaris]|nr:hypothetical protein DFH09DRAFT_1102458 [Mycena vulgaris]